MNHFSSKSFNILKAFNNHLIEFVEDLISIFPDDVTLKTSRTYIIGLRKVNPKSILVNWKYYVTDKDKDTILKGELDYFLHKNYQGDIADVSDNVPQILEIIEKLRKPLLQLNDQNKEKAKKYLCNLVKLSELY